MMAKVQKSNVEHMQNVHQWLKSNSTIRDDSHLSLDQERGGVATKLYSTCLKILQNLCQPSPAQESLQAHKVALREELGKLFLWGEGLKSGELDKALAFAEGLQVIVIKKFVEIGRLIIEITSLPDFSEASKPKLFQTLNTLLEQAGSIVCRPKIEDDQGSHNSSSDDSSDEESRPTIHDFRQIIKRLQTQNSHLARIGPTIQRSLARLEKDEIRSKSLYPPVVPFRVSSAAGVYVSLIQDKFKSAAKDLIERLGEANWQRHQAVRNIGVDTDGSTLLPSKLAEPASTAIFRPVSTFHDSGLGTSVPNESHYAPSHTSFLSSDTNGAVEDLRVPATPNEVRQGKPFECFLCHKTLTSIRNRVDWKIHVFADIRPYICTFSGCKEELVQFSSRNEWGEHEFKHHRVTRTWRCLDCPIICSNPTEYEKHVASSHRRQQAAISWQSTSELALDQQESPAELEQCPLCCVIPGGSRRLFINHVARHMEQIALLALPRDAEESDDEAEMNDDESLSNTISSAHLSGLSEYKDDCTNWKYALRSEHPDSRPPQRVWGTPPPFHPEGRERSMSYPRNPNQPQYQAPPGYEPPPFPYRKYAQGTLIEAPYVSPHRQAQAPPPPPPLRSPPPQGLPPPQPQPPADPDMWLADHDKDLMQARQKGLSWQTIASRYFPEKSPNACEDRYESLMKIQSSAKRGDHSGKRHEKLKEVQVEVENEHPFDEETTTTQSAKPFSSSAKARKATDQSLQRRKSSRKVVGPACAQCRASKIRCVGGDVDSPCSSCQNKDIKCVRLPERQEYLRQIEKDQKVQPAHGISQNSDIRQHNNDGQKGQIDQPPVPVSERIPSNTYNFANSTPADYRKTPLRYPPQYPLPIDFKYEILDPRDTQTEGQKAQINHPPVPVSERILSNVYNFANSTPADYQKTLRFTPMLPIPVERDFKQDNPVSSDSQTDGEHDNALGGKNDIPKLMIENGYTEVFQHQRAEILGYISQDLRSSKIQNIPNSAHLSGSSNEKSGSAIEKTSIDSQSLKKAYQQRRKGRSCNACRERKVKCDATDTSDCSQCTKRSYNCQFTIETRRQISKGRSMDIEPQSTGSILPPELRVYFDPKRPRKWYCGYCDYGPHDPADHLYCVACQERRGPTAYCARVIIEENVDEDWKTEEILHNPLDPPTSLRFEQ